MQAAVIVFVAVITIGSAVREQPGQSQQEALLQSLQELAYLQYGGDCIETLYIMAFTNDIKYADSDESHDVQLQANSQIRSLQLYDRVGDDYYRNKGDLWEISIDSFSFSASCIRIGDIQDVAIIEGNNDGWNIESIVTAVRDRDGNDEILTVDLGVNRWIDGNGASSDVRFDLTIVRGIKQVRLGHQEVLIQSRQELASLNQYAGDCLEILYIMAFTNDIQYADSDESHYIQLQVNNQIRSLRLYDRVGDDYFRNKGDLWECVLANFGFSSSCIRIDDIQDVAITEGGNDGWNIDSIVTAVRDSDGNDEILTVDLSVDRWIDGNGASSDVRFDLTIVA